MNTLEEQKIEVGLERLKNESQLNDLINDIHRSIDTLLTEDRTSIVKGEDNEQSIIGDNYDK